MLRIATLVLVASAVAGFQPAACGRRCRRGARADGGSGGGAASAGSPRLRAACSPRHRAVDADPLPATRRTRTKHSPALSPIAPSPCGRGAVPPDATALPACVLPPSVSPRTPPV